MTDPLAEAVARLERAGLDHRTAETVAAELVPAARRAENGRIFADIVAPMFSGGTPDNDTSDLPTLAELMREQRES